ETQEVNDADWKIVNTRFEIVTEMVQQLADENGFPRLFRMLVEGYDEIPDWLVAKEGKSKLEIQREAFEEKALNHIEHILANALTNLGSLVKGTKLEPAFGQRIIEKARGDE